VQANIYFRDMDNLSTCFFIINLGYVICGNYEERH